MARSPTAPRRVRRHLSAVTVCLGLFGLFACGPALHAQPVSLEYALKATYLYKFVPFIEWPTSAFKSPDSPVTLCVVGKDPFGDVLDHAVAGQRIGGRSIVVRRLPTATRQNGCHIMYISGSESQSIEDALKTVRGLPILTVTNSERSAWPKGVIHFIVQNNRVRFEIDDQAAAQNGLTISSKLLSLAVSVRRRA